MAATKIGGSANITLDLNVNTNWELTGLDGQGRVLLDVNVKIKQSIVPTASINIFLPTIASLNSRNVTFNIDSNNFGNIIGLKSIDSDKINGETTLSIAYPKQSVAPVSVSGNDNWTLPLLQQAP